MDGGGSKTRALIANYQGKILGEGISGPSNPNLVGINSSIHNLKEALLRAMDQCNLEHVKLAVFGVAGSETRKELSRRLQMELSFVEELVVLNDSLICLAAGTLGRPGVVVIAGTGSIALALDENGKVIRAGGWGYLLGDFGSGFDVGRTAVIETLKFLEGRSKQNSLVLSVLKELNVNDLEELLSSIYGSKNPISKLSSLASIVLKQAEEGDEVARRIVDHSIDSLISCVESVVRRSSFSSKPIPVVLSGGLFKNEYYSSLFLSKLKEKISDVEPKILKLEPAIGALILAFKRAGLLNSDILSELISYGGCSVDV